MGKLHVMDSTGDTKSIWDPNNQHEVDAARETFNNLRRKGHVAYRVGADGKASEVMTTFDAQAGSIIMRPPAAGG